MLTSTRKPGPPVPPRPSAAAVANALAKHRENSPSQQQHISGVHTLKPPHPGRTVVYKSPAFEQQVIKKPQSGDAKEPLGSSKTEVYVGESHGVYNNNVPRPVLPPATTISTNNSSSLENGKLMYTSTCSIIEINSSSSASTSASSSPVSTLQKTPDSKATNLLGIGGGHRNHFNSADEEDDTSICQKQLKNTYNHRHHHQLLDPLDNSSSDGDLIAIKRNSPDVIVISSSSEHDSGTEHNSMDTNSIASSNSLERENNLKNRQESSRTSHLTEIIIGSDGSDLVTNGTSTSTIIEATNHVIRSSSIRLPYRPEPEGGEHVTPSNDTNSNSVIKVTPPSIDPSTLDSKLSEKKVAFHELLISELTAMRSAAAAATGGQSDSISRRQRKPPEHRASPEVSPTGTARIRTADWIEVGDNGKEVVLSSCQISLEDSGLEDEGKHDEDGDDDGGSSGVGDSWDSVKDAEERITMSLPGLPPLPKSLSGFDLAGQQLQSHQQHHHQNHHHHQQHHPPQHQPPAPPQHYQQQQQHLQPPQQHQQQPHPQQQQTLPPSLNHHPTNPFIPIGVNLQSVSMASLVSQRGQSPVSSTVSSSSMAATPNSGSGSGGGGGGGGGISQQSGGSSVRKPTTLDTQLAILRREMYGLRQLDLSLLSQLWALNESIQEFRTMLQEQETLSPPSPTPSNSDANSVSSDDDEDDSSNTQTVGGAGGAILTNHHNLIESVAAASVLSSAAAAAQTASSRMRAPPPPPPNRKAPSRPV
uniref:Putative mediator of rna polymerase ii transcription subunit 26 n=1 Tax=Culex tarsalis TaxID=7177 RepID=A0A1Q3FLY2_CULTA